MAFAASYPDAEVRDLSAELYGPDGDQEPDLSFDALHGSAFLLDRVDGDFATEQNVTACLLHLNSVLDIHGYPNLPLIEPSAPSSMKVALAAACNTTHALLQQRQRDMEYRDKVNVDKRRATHEAELTESQITRLQNTVEQKEKEIREAIMRERQQADASAEKVTKLSAEREEMRKLNEKLLRKETQYQHSLRQKEQQYEKLQEKLNKVLVDKRKEARGAMSATAVALKSPVASNLKGGKAAEDYYRQIMQAYEKKQAELIVENGDLRASLRNLQKELQELLNEQVYHRPLDTPPKTPGVLPDSLFELPYNSSREEIEENLRQRMAIIQERLERVEASKRQYGGNREAAKLKKMVEELQVLVKEQEGVIQMALAARVAATPPKPLAAGEISERQRELEEKLREVERERRQSLGVADQLEKDKRQLENEKAQFEEEKRQFQGALKLWAPGMGAGKFLARAISSPDKENVDGEGWPISLNFTNVEEVRIAGGATLKELRRVFDAEYAKNNQPVSAERLSGALKEDKLLVTLAKSSVTRDRWDALHNSLLSHRGGPLTWEEVTDMYYS